MTDPERLQRVALALAQAVDAGERGNPVKLPVIQRGDAAGLINFMHAELDDAIARRDAQMGARIACHKGCNACCASPVLISEGEAVAVAEWLREPAHADVRARFEAAYSKWREQLGDLLDPTDGRDAEWMSRVQRRQAMCAFNHEGACSIYPVRPALCRKTHALDTSENCASEDVAAQCFQHPETEELYESQRPLRFALHKALRPNSRLDLLCAAVSRSLGGTAATGRNESCPCGSGKKYKKCCGV
jgi:Fe-S-cluster containining protein